jgi:hypothetical protein
MRSQDDMEENEVMHLLKDADRVLAAFTAYHIEI